MAATAAPAAADLTLGDALAIVGAWPAALAVGQPGVWRLVCRRAAAKSTSADIRDAWTALGRRGRTDIAARLHAAGIYI